MSKPYRLSAGGSRIDRTRRVSFSFDGRQLTGFAGDTLASAVSVAGQRVFGRSSSITAHAAWWASVRKR